MPLYLCRWPNGDCSVVWATNKGEAIEILDEVDNAEGCHLTALRDFMIHFHLSEAGELELEGFGEATEDALFRVAYPTLDEALMKAPCDAAGNPTPEGVGMIREAVAQERKRVRLKKVREPETELGREIKKMTDVPTKVIDRTIRESGSETLKQFRGRGKPS